jgi:hypothetical protein
MMRGFPDDPPRRTHEEIERDVAEKLWIAIWLDDLKRDKSLRAMTRDELRREMEDLGFSERVVARVLADRFGNGDGPGVVPKLPCGPEK